MFTTEPGLGAAANKKSHDTLELTAPPAFVALQFFGLFFWLLTCPGVSYPDIVIDYRRYEINARKIF
jgi:hypothetical protein